MKITTLLNKLFQALAKIFERFSFVFEGYGHITYSIEGEDSILKEMFNKLKIKKGFYVDIGAHHPKRYSNTYFFYKLGWRGINIDANPGSMAQFSTDRPRDVNLELAISDRAKELTFYQFDDGALNTFSKIRSEEIIKNGHYHLKNTIKIKTKRLSTILEGHLPYKQRIDFLNIDVEGMDLEVLKSNDWNKYSPKIILVEERPFNQQTSKISKFLKQKGYEFFAQTIRTIFYVQKKVNF